MVWCIPFIYLAILTSILSLPLSRRRVPPVSESATTSRIPCAQGVVDMPSTSRRRGALLAHTLLLRQGDVCYCCISVCSTTLFICVSSLLCRNTTLTRMAPHSPLLTLILKINGPRRLSEGSLLVVAECNTWRLSAADSTMDSVKVYSLILTPSPTGSLPYNPTPHYFTPYPSFPPIHIPSLILSPLPSQYSLLCRS